MDFPSRENLSVRWACCNEKEKAEAAAAAAVGTGGAAGGHPKLLQGSAKGHAPVFGPFTENIFRSYR